MLCLCLGVIPDVAGRGWSRVAVSLMDSFIRGSDAFMVF
jgi:hypothetical protein